jgi:hypothetical protein
VAAPTPNSVAARQNLCWKVSRWSVLTTGPPYRALELVVELLRLESV